MQRRHLHHFALFAQGGVNFHQPANHLIAEALAQPVEMAHTVKDRHDQRLLTYGGRDILHRLRQAETFYRQDNQIPGAAQRARLRQLRLQLLHALRRAQHQPVLL